MLYTMLNLLEQHLILKSVITLGMPTKAIFSLKDKHLIGIANYLELTQF